MGAAITIRDYNNVELTVSAVKKCGSSEIQEKLMEVKNGTTSLQETRVGPTDQSYVGELSADICLDSKKWISLFESQKIVVQAVYTLPDSNIGIPKFQGLGHVIFRYHGRCTSVQLCLDDLTIQGTTATATYSGFLEKFFEINPCNKTSIDVCTTFIITCHLTTFGLF